MASCELCGEETGFLNNVNVSGSVLKVCKNCKSMGMETMGTGNKSHTFKRRIKDNETYEEIVENYPSLIQSALSRKGWTIHQLARGTNIKESSLNGYMKRTIKLDVETAKRIGKFLDIELVESVSDEGDSSPDSYIDNDSDGSGQSLGDMISDLLNKKNDN